MSLAFARGGLSAAAVDSVGEPQSERSSSVDTTVASAVGASGGEDSLARQSTMLRITTSSPRNAFVCPSRRTISIAPSLLPVDPSPPPQPPPCAMLLVVLAGAPVRIEQGVRGSSTAARTIGSTAADRSGRRSDVRREARSARL